MSEAKPSFGLHYGAATLRVSEQVRAQGFRLTEAHA
jgi:hypothetical protein